jgi:hypothetical protein
MHEEPILVISSEARDLAFLATYEEKISRLWLEITIVTQSQVAGEDRGRGLSRAQRLNVLNSYEPSGALGLLSMA